MDVENIDPIATEEFMPPMHSLSYRVLFYYTEVRTAQEFWKDEGKYWSHEIDNFMSVGKLGGIAGGIVALRSSYAEGAEDL